MLQMALSASTVGAAQLCDDFCDLSHKPVEFVSCRTHCYLLGGRK
jgi:hypothetical protein